MKLSELRKELELIKAKQAEVCESLKGSDNPNVVRLFLEHETILNYTIDILNRINGDRLSTLNYRQ